MADHEKIPDVSEVPEKGDNEWNIPEQHIEHVMGRLTKLNDRIQRRNLTPFKITEVLRYVVHLKEIMGLTGEIRWARIYDPKKFNEFGVRTALYIRLRVEGEEQVISGWKFIGSVQHKGEAGNVLANAPGQTIPTGYHAAPATNCDHCHTKQLRNETYILQNEKTGEYQQIGGSCLRDFLGLDPKAMLDFNDHFQALRGDLDEYEDEERHRVDRFVYQSTTYMAYTAACIRQLGWVSRQRAMASEYDDRPLTATSEVALNNAFHWERPKGARDDNEGRIMPSEKDIEIAKAARQWILDGFGKTGELSDFEQNLQVVARMDYHGLRWRPHRRPNLPVIRGTVLETLCLSGLRLDGTVATDNPYQRRQDDSR